MAHIIHLRVPNTAARVAVLACHDCRPGAPAHLIAGWIRDAAGRPARRWSLATHVLHEASDACLQDQAGAPEPSAHFDA